MRTTKRIWRSGLNNVVITIPKEIRDVLGLKIGDYVEVDIIKAGDAILKQESILVTPKKASYKVN